MKRLTIAAMVVATAVGAARCGGDSDNPTGPSNSGPIVFTAQLSAANEVPPITNAESGGRGSATVTMNVPRDSSGVPTGAGTTNWSIQLTSLPPGTAIILGHIHTGAAGVNGGVLVNTGLSPAAPALAADGTVNLTFTNIDVTATNALNIYNNPAGFYVNFHTPLNPGGVVRGQLTRTQ